MSFNFNSINNFNQPIIKQPSKTGDGSGGNTGYFQQGQGNEDQDQDQNQDKFETSIFEEDDDKATLKVDNMRIFKNMFKKLKNLFFNK